MSIKTFQQWPVRRLQVITKHLIHPETQIRPKVASQFDYHDVSSVSRQLTPSVAVKPKKALHDEKINVQLLGFPAEEKVTLHGQVLQGEKNTIFASCGHYMTDSKGFVDITQSSSLGGTYTGVEPMGILWSLKPGPGQPPHVRMTINHIDRPLIVSLKAYLGHLDLTDLYSNCSSAMKSLASTEIERLFQSPDVTRIEVEEGNVRGALYLPGGDRPCQGVIDMFGSSGGIIEYRAALLASRGFAALSLPYFKYKDLQESLLDLKYDYFEEAVNWLSSHPKVCKGGIGVMAVSKGVENALCMGAYSSKVRAVIIINGFPYMTIGDMWYRGQILHKACQYDLSKIEFTDEGLDIRLCIDQPNEPIPIWKGEAKYLVFASLDDYQVKPGFQNELLQACPPEKRKDIKIVKYPGAGHLLEPPYIPLCRTSVNRGFGLEMKWGGQPKEHAQAQEDAWSLTLEFFRTNIPTS